MRRAARAVGRQRFRDMSKQIVLAIAGSPRRGGNSDRLLAEAMRGTRDAGHEVVHVVVQDYNLQGCLACGGCGRDGNCRVSDDMQKVFADLDRADHIILAAPVFFMGLPGKLKMLIDRCQVYWSRKYRLKQPVGRERPGGNGVLIAIGGTTFEKLFDGSRNVAKSLFSVLEVHYRDELLLSRVDRRGDIERHPEALRRAYEIGLHIGDRTD